MPVILVLRIPQLENFVISQPVILVLDNPSLENFATSLPVLLFYSFHLLRILQYLWGYATADRMAEHEQNSPN